MIDPTPKGAELNCRKLYPAKVYTIVSIDIDTCQMRDQTTRIRIWYILSAGALLER
jgi:hypothetical protein